MEKNQKTKYHKEAGLILNYCEIRIDKPSKTVKYIHKQYKVIISNEHQYVVESNYGRLQVLNKIAKYSTAFDTVNKVHVHEQKWQSRYLEDYLYAKSVSTFSEKVTKTRVKNALIKFINKEAYFYTGLEYEIENQLKKSTFLK